MPSLKGLALGAGVLIVLGFVALRTKAGEGLSSLASGITRTISAPLVGVGGGLKILGEGVSTFLSPTISPTIRPILDLSGFKIPGFGTQEPTSGAREEDRNGSGAGVRTSPSIQFFPFAPKRGEDRDLINQGVRML